MTGSSRFFKNIAPDIEKVKPLATSGLLAELVVEPEYSCSTVVAPIILRGSQKPVGQGRYCRVSSNFVQPTNPDR